MKDFHTLKFSAASCRTELQKFKLLLDSREELSERNDLLPFFKENLHLSAFVGSYNPAITSFDLVAHEFDLFGDFSCDLVVGDSQRKAFAFIEFEDARSESVFQKLSHKATPEWARRFEHGFSQLVDWFWKIDELKSTVTFKDRFGTNLGRCSGMLAIGRKETHNEREARRLVWRTEKVIVDSFKVSCLTFDELYDDLKARLESMEQLSKKN